MLNLGNPTNQAPRKPFHWLLEFPEVFLEGETKGFDAIVGNPPFQGGQKITGTLGTDYRNFLVEYLANGQRGSADLCAYFFLRAVQLVADKHLYGFIATSAILEGDTREVCLDKLVQRQNTIIQATSVRVWPGTANVTYASVCVYKGLWEGQFLIENEPVAGITSFLTTASRATGKPHTLISNSDKSFNGSKIYGPGFVLNHKEVHSLIEKDSRNKDVILPYLVGEELNAHPAHQPSRFVINFQDWPLDVNSDDPKTPQGPPYASDYPDCLEIVEERVKPGREILKDNPDGRKLKQYWWQYGRTRPELYSTISNMNRCMAIATQATKYVAFAFFSERIIFSHALAIIALEEASAFALLHSSLHDIWARKYGSYNLSLLRYNTSDCFETFPFPTPNPLDLGTQFSTLNRIGETYYTYRQAIMLDRQEGLTKTYNRFHEPQRKRDRHCEIAIASCRDGSSGGDRLRLARPRLRTRLSSTKQGIRYTISETARREVLDRLLELNHQRYAEEVAQGLHDKKKGKGKTSKKKASVKANSPSDQIPLF
jgi:hypothetical protein